MRNYSRAYYLKDLRAFAGWNDHARPGSAELADDTVVFLLDDFTVVGEETVLNDVQAAEDYVFQHVTPEWREFCEQQLEFAIPEDLRFMYEEEPAAVPAS